MKRFLLFAGSVYYPSGGWEDYKGSFDTYEDAKARFSSIDDDWYQIVDSEQEAVVENATTEIYSGGR